MFDQPNICLIKEAHKKQHLHVPGACPVTAEKDSTAHAAWFDKCLETLQSPKMSSNGEVQLEYVFIGCGEKDPGFDRLIQINGALKSTVAHFQNTIRNSVFKDVLNVYVFAGVNRAVVYFKYGGHRAKNRIKAYSERYEELRAALGDVTVQLTT